LIAEVLDRLKGGPGLAVAAHPLEPAGLLERLILRRGRWSETDLETTGLSGIQLLNGEPNGAFAAGLKCWVKLLLKGKRPVLMAGSDAHGNFNRMRQLGFPCLKMRESSNQVLGSCWTGVYSPEGAGEGRILEGIRRGRVYISNGPFIDLIVRPSGRPEGGEGGESVDVVRAAETEVTISVRSSPEFGEIDRVRLLWGGLATGGELPLESLKTVSTGTFECKMTTLFRPPCRGYLRAEVQTAGPDHIALTNPVRLKPF
jgi:hypothetical protein